MPADTTPDTTPETEIDLSRIDFLKIEDEARALRAQAIRHMAVSARAWIKRRFTASAPVTRKPA